MRAFGDTSSMMRVCELIMQNGQLSTECPIGAVNLQEIALVAICEDDRAVPDW